MSFETHFDTLAERFNNLSSSVRFSATLLQPATGTAFQKKCSKSCDLVHFVTEQYGDHSCLVTKKSGPKFVARLLRVSNSPRRSDCFRRLLPVWRKETARYRYARTRRTYKIASDVRKERNYQQTIMT